MTDIEILQKAIEKAEKNGYKNPFVLYSITELIVDYPFVHNNEGYEDYSEWSILAIIFSHDFAKAFWQDAYFYKPPVENIKELPTVNNEENDVIWIKQSSCGAVFKNNKWIYPFYPVDWQYHLQQMVLEKEPLKYLEKFL